MILSNDFKIACEIYKAELNQEPIWFTKLTEILYGKIGKTIISDSLDALSDYGIVRYVYGATNTGCVAGLLYICDEHKNRIKIIYDAHYSKCYSK